MESQKMLRVGEVTISSNMLDDEPYALLPFFSKFIPIHIEHQTWKGQVKYIGYSELFDLTDITCPLPNYKVLFHKDKDNNIIDEVKLTREE